MVPLPRTTRPGRLVEIFLEAVRKLVREFEAASVGKKVGLTLLFLPNLAAEAWANAPTAMDSWLDAAARAAPEQSLADLVRWIAGIDRAVDALPEGHATLKQRARSTRAMLRTCGVARANTFLNDIDTEWSAPRAQRGRHLEAVERSRSDILALEDASLITRLATVDRRLNLQVAP